MAGNAKLSVTLSILNSYFSETGDMLSYLSELLEPVPGHDGSISEYLLTHSDSPAYRALISTSYVASKTLADAGYKRRFKIYPPMVYMRDVSTR